MSSTVIASLFEQRPRVDDAFMRDATLGARIKHVIGAHEAFGDVVGVQDRDAGRLRKAFAAHHQAVAQILQRPTPPASIRTSGKT